LVDGQGIEPRYENEGLCSEKGKDDGGNPEPEHNAPVGVLSDERELEDIIQEVNDCRKRDGDFHGKKEGEHGHEKGPEAETRKERKPEAIRAARQMTKYIIARRLRERRHPQKKRPGLARAGGVRKPRFPLFTGVHIPKSSTHSWHWLVWQALHSDESPLSVSCSEQEVQSNMSLPPFRFRVGRN